jgi:hypothetical protein
VIGVFVDGQQCLTVHAAVAAVCMQLALCSGVCRRKQSLAAGPLQHCLLKEAGFSGWPFAARFWNRLLASQAPAQFGEHAPARMLLQQHVL